MLDYSSAIAINCDTGMIIDMNGTIVLMNCKQCGKEFHTQKRYRRIYCSNRCREDYFRKLNKGPNPYVKNISSGTVGAIAELIVGADLLGKGYQVFRSLSPNAFCDLVAIKGAELRKIEVRTGLYKKDLSLSYPKRHHTDATEFAIYTQKDNLIHYVPINWQPPQ